MKIGVLYPNYYMADTPASRFHGYARAFIEKYCDYLYVGNYHYYGRLGRSIFFKYENCAHFKIRSFKKNNMDKCDILIIFHIPEDKNESYKVLSNYKGMVIAHANDYLMDNRQAYDFYKKTNTAYLIGHTQMDKYCDFFCKYYLDYVGKVIDLPFGYGRRFVSNKDFLDRKNLAVGLGSIYPNSGNLYIDEETIADYIDFFGKQGFQHPLRKHILDNANKYADCIDSKFPSVEQMRDFKYDAVEMLNNYRMFINDAGNSMFPPARTFEGIACGTVMVAEKLPIYENLGFMSDYNYIGFERGNYDNMRDRILYYKQHEDKLVEMQKNSVRLSKQFTHEKIADLLYKSLQDIYSDGGTGH